MSPRTPTLANVIAGAIRAALGDLFVATFARVERYDSTRQCVDAQPLIMAAYDNEEGERVAEALPVVTDAPVMFYGSGAYRDTFPIAVGSTVVLVFMSRSIDRWLQSGGLVDPGDDRGGNLSDAVAFPVGHDFAHVPTDAPEDARVMHAPLIRLGSSAANDPVIRKSDLDAFIATYNAHVHAFAPGGPSPTATPTSTQGPIAGSSVVKAG